MAWKIRQDDYQRYLHSKAWRDRRREALRLADHRCARCHRQGDLEVHHRSYERFGDERPEDLLVLCARCHRREHGIAYRPKRRQRKKRYVSVRFVDPEVLRRRGTAAALEHAFWSGYAPPDAKS